MPSRSSARNNQPLAVVFDAHGVVDIAHDLPMFLVGDWHEFLLRRLGDAELLQQIGPLPFEGEEGLFHFLRQLRLKVVDIAVACGREGLGLVQRDDLILPDHVAPRHALDHRIGDRGDRKILVDDAHDRIVVLAGEHRFEVLAGHQSEFLLQQSGGRLEPGIRSLRCEGDLLALQVLDLGHAAAGIGDDLELVAVFVGERSHHRERHEARAIHRQRIGAGVEARYMQAARAHCFELRCVGLDREELHPLAGDLFHMADEPVPDLRIDCGILNRRIGKTRTGGSTHCFGSFGASATRSPSASVNR